MTTRKNSTSAVFGLISIGFGIISLPAAAYPIDCAILLCLSGGWPASAECTAAKAEVIRRITPFPVEPPLQIWRCPMQSAGIDGYLSPRLRLAQLTASPAPTLARLVQASANYPMQNNGFEIPLTELPSLAHRVSQQADVDISGSSFDFVRSIRVWHVKNYRQIREDPKDPCTEIHEITLGTYSAQGEFAWRMADIEENPAWLCVSRNCSPLIEYRGVGIEWSDYTGVHGYEVVRY
jgi:hypothetical protein